MGVQGAQGSIYLEEADLRAKSDDTSKGSLERRSVSAGTRFLKTRDAYIPRAFNDGALAAPLILVGRRPSDKSGPGKDSHLRHGNAFFSTPSSVSHMSSMKSGVDRAHE